jgi:hypothetical protein
MGRGDRNMCNVGAGGRLCRPGGMAARAQRQRQKEGARWGTMGSPTINDHGLLNREPAIGRQIQDTPLA